METSIFRWLAECPHLGNLFIAAARTGAEGALLRFASAGADEVMQTFIGGSERRRAFTVTLLAPYSDSPNDEGSLAPYARARALVRWVETRNAQGALPELGAGRAAVRVGAEYTPIAVPAQGATRRLELPVRCFVDYLETEETV